MLNSRSRLSAGSISPLTPLRCMATAAAAGLLFAGAAVAQPVPDGHDWLGGGSSQQGPARYNDPFNWDEGTVPGPNTYIEFGVSVNPFTRFIEINSGDQASYGQISGGSDYLFANPFTLGTPTVGTLTINDTVDDGLSGFYINNNASLDLNGPAMTTNDFILGAAPAVPDVYTGEGLLSVQNGSVLNLTASALYGTLGDLVILGGRNTAGDFGISQAFIGGSGSQLIASGSIIADSAFFSVADNATAEITGGLTLLETESIDGASANFNSGSDTTFGGGATLAGLSSLAVDDASVTFQDGIVTQDNPSFISVRVREGGSLSARDIRFGDSGGNSSGQSLSATGGSTLISERRQPTDAVTPFYGVRGARFSNPIRDRASSPPGPFMLQ